MGSIASRSILAALLLSFYTAPAQVKPGQCGVERWAVKTLDDRDARKVDFTPVDRTIGALVGVRIHEIPYPDDSRIAPEELHVFRVRARLVGVRRESDQDLHIIIEDPERKGVTMVVEVPAPRCGPARYADRFKETRNKAASLVVGATITVTGVGFWDYIHGHGVTGAARNGFELHRVLKIE